MAARASWLCLLLLLPSLAAAQTDDPIRGQRMIQAGPGLLPGIGLEVGYLLPASLFTREAVLYVDSSPQFAGGEGSVQLSLGLGGAIRILGVARFITTSPYTGKDLDFGLRFGPGLFFAIDETRAEKNQRFSLFLEPFIRYSSTFAAGRVFFFEAGIQRPLFRGGLLFRL
jgi:hypothetical protein